MNKLAILTAAAAALVASTLAASAHDNINRVQERQLDRIEAGRHAGSITFREGIALRREQRRIAALEARFRKSGGGLSKAERQVLHQLQHDARKNIRAEKNDRQKRIGFLPRFGK